MKPHATFCIFAAVWQGADGFSGAAHSKPTLRPALQRNKRPKLSMTLLDNLPVIESLRSRQAKAFKNAKGSSMDKVPDEVPSRSAVFFENVRPDYINGDNYNPPSFLKTTVSSEQARALLAVVAAVYGTNFGCVKLLDQTLSPALAAAARFSIAAVALLPLAVATRPNKSLMLPLLAGVETGLWCTLAYGAQSVSLQTVSAGKSAFICALVVLVVPLLDSLKGQPPPRRAWIAAALATLGVAVLELGDCGGTLESLTRDDWLSLLQPIGFGLGFWRMEAFGHKFPRDALPLAAGQVAGVALAASAWAMYEFGCMDAASGAEGWSIAAEGLRAAVHDIEVAPSGTAAVLITLAWTGLASTAATVLGESIALTQLSAAEATLIFSTEPIWGAAFAYAALGEKMGPCALAGGALIVGTCLWNAQQQGQEVESGSELLVRETDVREGE